MSGKQRFFTRHPITLRVRVRTTKGWVEMETIDISRRGVFIRTEDPLDEQKIAQLRLTMPNGSELEAMGHVRRVVRAPAPTEHGMGIEFFVMSKEAEQEWDGFVLDQSRNAAGVSSMVVAVDANQQPSGTPTAADGMVELPVVRESLEATLPQTRRTSDLVHGATMVGLGNEGRIPVVVTQREPERPTLVATASPAARHERSFFLADVDVDTMPAWGSGGVEAESGPPKHLDFGGSARQPTRSGGTSFEDEDLPWATTPSGQPGARDLLAPGRPGPDDEVDEAFLLSRPNNGEASGSAARAQERRGDTDGMDGNSARPNLPGARQDAGQPTPYDGASASLRWPQHGPGAGRDHIEDDTAARTQPPLAAGATVANARKRQSAIQGPTVATGSPAIVPLPVRPASATRHAPAAGAPSPHRSTIHALSALATVSPAAKPAALGGSKAGSDETVSGSDASRAAAADKGGAGAETKAPQGSSAKAARRHAASGGIFITVRPRDVEHLRQFIDRRIRQANVFLRSTVACAPGQSVDVAVIHPVTDAEVIVSGTVARAIRGETEAENGFLLRFSELEDHLQSRLQHFVETGHPQVRAPTSVTGQDQQSLRQTAERESDSADAWLSYGWSLLVDTENPIEAIDAFQRALMMSPERAEIHDGLSLAYALAGEAAKSYAFLRSSRQLAKSAQSAQSAQSARS